MSSEKVERKNDGTIVISLTIPWKTVEEGYKKAIAEYKKNLEIKGFRKGKAPDNLVIEEVGKQKLYTQTLQIILPDAYAAAVKSENLQPITNPKIEAKKIEEGSDWELSVTTAERPKFELGDYKKVVSDVKAVEKIWVPGTEAETGKKREKPEESLEKRLGKIFDALIENIKITLPAYLIEEQVNQDLSRLVSQLERLGLTLDQYLLSLKKTAENLRAEYQSQAERTLKLEFILSEIANDQKITVFEEEVDELIDKVGDEKLKSKLKSSAVERASIRESLRKRKVTDELLKL
jgi:FKBP-type peptidyl-prolyl cis-trans isomerase (trigger factor)